LIPIDLQHDELSFGLRFEFVQHMTVLSQTNELGIHRFQFWKQSIQDQNLSVYWIANIKSTQTASQITHCEVTHYSSRGLTPVRCQIGTKALA
jgi:hypothetical protein